MTHRSLEYPCIHKVLEVWICKVRLHELCLFFQHSSHEVYDVIIEGYLCYLPVAIADGIREVNACGDTGWQFLNLSLHFVTSFPLDVAVRLPDSTLPRRFHQALTSAALRHRRPWSVQKSLPTALVASFAILQLRPGQAAASSPIGYQRTGHAIASSGGDTEVA